MRVSQLILCTLFLANSAASRQHAAHHSLIFNQMPIQSSELKNSSSYDLPLLTREHWMRVASSANHAISPCPFAPFGTAIVNHTLSFSDPTHLGELICMGVNDNGHSGNPTLHGEMVGIGNCTSILTDPEGLYKLSASETKEAWRSFSLPVVVSNGASTDTRTAMPNVCWCNRLGGNARGRVRNKHREVD